MFTTLGILAHVDAGKTTLSEQFLYHSGVLRSPGRVDQKNAFLDYGTIERERGITVFSDQAVFETGGRKFQLVDTPGHVDFSGEMERCLQILDCAVLVISCVAIPKRFGGFYGRRTSPPSSFSIKPTGWVLTPKNS